MYATSMQLSYYSLLCDMNNWIYKSIQVKNDMIQCSKYLIKFNSPVLINHYVFRLHIIIFVLNQYIFYRIDKNSLKKYYVFWARLYKCWKKKL